MTQEKETLMNWTAINVTSGMNFSQVMRTENVMKIIFVRLFINLSIFMLYIASWKLDSLNAQ